jgi:hypothetical protein
LAKESEIPLQPWILPASRCDISALAGWNGQRIIWVSLRQRKTVPIPVNPCWPMDGDDDYYCNWWLTVNPSFYLYDRAYHSAAIEAFFLRCIAAI